ncbi:MAG: hypothetical protein EKK29_15455 [Hyphomicrobiales bacterium]|nr:MAG: hypothetical protein EKK29_15455 [Hyphomicrobiales bacterium]
MFSVRIALVFLLFCSAPAYEQAQAETTSPNFEMLRIGCNPKWLKINFSHPANLPSGIVSVLQSVSNYYNCTFSDDVEINISFDYRPLGKDILGEAKRETVTVPYRTVRSLILNKTGFDKKIQDLNPVDDTVSFLTSSGTKIFSSLVLTRANAKALGIVNPKDHGTDTTITMSTGYNWTFDEYKGVPNTYSLMTVLTHEVGHALGFISGVDDSENPDFLDVYRHSDTSVASGGASILWLPDVRSPTCNEVKYFFTSPVDKNPASKDCILAGGCNLHVEYSKGKKNGCDFQGSHWRDNQGIGLMDPTTATGEYQLLSGYDIQALYYLGWTPTNLRLIHAPGELPGILIDCNQAGANCVELP